MVKKRKEKGQALVETVITVVLLFGIFFGLMQLFHLATLRINAFDAAGAATRAAIVRKNALYAGNYVFLSEKVPEVVIPKIYLGSENTKTNLINSEGENLTISIGQVNYLQKVMFPEFFTFFGFRWLPGSAVCKMTNSPEPEYLSKSYPKAKRDE